MATPHVDWAAGGGATRSGRGSGGREASLVSGADDGSEGGATTDAFGAPDARAEMAACPAGGGRRRGSGMAMSGSATTGGAA